MNTQIIPIEWDSPDERQIARAAQALRSGKLVAFPTETVYGLGANALNSAAVARIFEAKGRPARNPVIVHIANVESAQALVTEWPTAASALAERFWPGPLTIVLPKREIIPDIVTAGGPTVALRIPAHPVAMALLTAAALPVAAPSANRSMQLSPTTAEHVARGLAGRIEMILDAGPTAGGIESTVLSLAGAKPFLLRPGLISPGEIEALIGPIGRRNSARQRDSDSQEPLASPGLLARHYAPRARLEIVNSSEDRVQELLEKGEKVGWLVFAAPSDRVMNSQHLIVEVMPRQPGRYGSRLYAALHELDQADVAYIIVEALPDTDDWLALRDRLERAAA